MRRSFLSLICLAPFVSFAQVPFNYDCDNAIPLPVANGNVQVEFTFINAWNFPGALPDPATTCSGSTNKGSGWYSFVATNTRHWVRTEGDRLDDASIEVFSGSCGSLTSLLCMPATSAYVPLTGLTVGTTYLIRVVTPFPCGSGVSGQCQLGLAVVSDPLHDDCAGAIELTVMNPQAQAYPATEIATLGATQSQPGCVFPTASNDDVWYRFTATATAHHFPHSTLRTNGAEDVVVQWFSGSCGALTSIACNEPRATGLTVGQQYFIRVYTESTDATVNERIMGDVCASAPNDECSGAFPITVAQSGEDAQPVKVSTWLGTSSAVPCDTQPTDVWLTFTAPSTTVTAWSSSPQKLAFFGGSCGSLVCLITGTTTGGAPSVQCDNLTVGATYFLKIGDTTSPDNSSIRMYATPDNDECTAATPLSVQPLGSSSGFTYGHSFAATVSGPTACMGPQPADVWYSFTATATSHLIHRKRLSPGIGFDVEVLGGACGALTSLYCGAFVSGPDLVTGLVPGTPYYIRVFNTVGTEPTAFSIAVTLTVENDECESATELFFADVTDHENDDRTDASQAVIGTSTCGAALRDMWYKFTAVDPTAAFVVAQPNAANGGGYVELLSGTCGNLTSISCPTQYPRPSVRYSGLIPGTEYFLRVNQLFSFTPMLIGKPANDEITGAQVVPVGGSAMSYSPNEGFSYGATQSFPVLCGANLLQVNDTWFTFTATASSHTVQSFPRNPRFWDEDQLASLRMEVYDTLSTIADTLDAHMIGCGGATITLTGLTVGNEYWYRVFNGAFSSVQVCTFTTHIYSGNNDEAAGALTLTYADDYTLFFNTSGATQSQPGADCSVDDHADDDIWFKFVANGQAGRVVAGHSSANLALELFSGTPGSLVSVACSDNILVLPSLTSGQTYYVRLYSWEDAVPTEGRLGLFATPSLTANTCVDEACLGPVLLANASIEQGAYCLVGFPSINTVQGQGIPIAPGWPRMQHGSADAYGSCEDNTRPADAPAAGVSLVGERVIPRSGKGMAGIIVKDASVAQNYREYIGAELSEALIPGEPYLISFHVAHAPASPLRVNGMGAVLSRGPLVEGWYEPIDAVPQVVTLDVVGDGWTNICGIVVPDEAWNTITIGCFFAENAEYTYEGVMDVFNLAYYFIDDVVVAHIDDPGCITSIGDVLPWDEGNQGGGDALRVYPNPADDRVDMVADADLFGQRAVIEVFDATGSRVHAEQVGSFGALQPLDLSRDWKEGLYLVMVRVEAQAPRSARLVLKR